ncbi:MAG: hypothetical protein KJ000_14045 [Pirellulaceae bacterium]|nr:hypothetical protein [Pirellulaceae bacterium]
MNCCRRSAALRDRDDVRPTAHAVGYTLSPLRGLMYLTFTVHGLTPMATRCRRSAALRDRDDVRPTAHAVGYTLSPLRGWFRRRNPYFQPRSGNSV